MTRSGPRELTSLLALHFGQYLFLFSRREPTKIIYSLHLVRVSSDKIETYRASPEKYQFPIIYD
jgi:hypothetical protein